MRLLSCLVVLPLIPVLGRADVQVLNGAGVVHATIQEAVDAASDGDILVVAPGTYPGFEIEGKSLSVIRTGSAPVVIAGRVEVRGLAASQFVILSGMSMIGQGISPDPGVVLVDNAGAVRAQDCRFEGGAGGLDPRGRNGTDGGDALQIEGCVGIALVACTIVGGDGGEPGAPEWAAGEGGRGLRSFDSDVALYDCTVRGGGGADGFLDGGDAGPGASVDSRLFASGSTFVGGDGGSALDSAGFDPGDGGNGLVVEPLALTRLLDVSTSGGGGGTSAGPQGAPGEALVELGTVRSIAGTAREFSNLFVRSDSNAATVKVKGEPGDRVYLSSSSRPGHAYRPTLHGVLLTPAPPVLPLQPLGVLPASGVATFTLGSFDLEDGSLGRQRFLQGYVVDAGGKHWLGSPMHTVLLDRKSGPDCDGDGVSDIVEALEGAPDCDGDLLSDSCQPDCNGNGIADACDIASGSSGDCDSNLVPDDCEELADCNLNGIHDGCDVTSGTSTDGNQNGIPDECEGQTLYVVDNDAPPGGDGSPAAPFRTLREAFDIGGSGDEIVLADGLYLGPDNRDLDFEGRSLTVRSMFGPQNCIIDCEELGRAFLVESVERAEIRGLTIMQGRAFPETTGDTFGGGISFVAGSVLSPDLTVVDCWIIDCDALFQGGGVHLLGTTDHDIAITVGRCTFVNCGRIDGPDGGGLFIGFGAPRGVVHDCTFLNNYGRIGGGATVSASLISHSVFLGNEASDHGGGIGTWGSVIDHCLIAGNDAGARGGGIWATAFAPTEAPRVSNSTLVQNHANRGGGYFVRGNGFPSIANSILHGNTASEDAPQILARAISGPLPLPISYSDIEGGEEDIVLLNEDTSIEWLDGNLDVGPRFRDPDGADDDPNTLTDNDYRLAEGSKLIDAGDNGGRGRSPSG